MNAGIRAATGDVIAHLHSDDHYLNPHILSKVAVAFEESGHEWLIGWIMKDIDGRLEPDVPKQTGFSQRRFAAGILFVPHPATFVRRTLFERVGFFDEGLRCAMDNDLWQRITAVGTPPVEIREFLTAVRRHAGRLSTANALATMREGFRVHLRHARHAPFPFVLFTARFAVRFVRRYLYERRIRRRPHPAG